MRLATRNTSTSPRLSQAKARRVENRRPFLNASTWKSIGFPSIDLLLEGSILFKKYSQPTTKSAFLTRSQKHLLPSLPLPTRIGKSSQRKSIHIMFWDKYRNVFGSQTAPTARDTMYEKLPEQDNLSEDDLSKHDNHPRVSTLKKRLTWSAAAGMSIIVLVTFILRANSSPKLIPWTDCGTTPEEARQRGCSYEPMQRAWIPPECYFQEPSDEYDVFRDRKWFADKELTIPSNIERLESGDEILSYTRYWHDEHCTYVFRKLALAVDAKRVLVNSRLANIAHSNHCARMVAKRIVNSYNMTYHKYDTTFTESELAFETCAQIYT